MEGLARRKPSFVDSFVTDLSGYTTTMDFWRYMFKFNKNKYEPLFFKHTNTLTTKTEVRGLIRAHPRLIKDLTPDYTIDSKLTVKEWILLCNTVMNDNRNQKIFDGWEFPPDLQEAFKIDLTMEMLNGKSKLSKRFQTAMNKVLKKPEEVIDEDQSLE